MRKTRKQPRLAARQKHRLYLVEGHPLTREGFAHLLNFEPDLHVCGQAGSAAAALAEIPAAKPNLVVVDISLAGTSGIQLIKDILARHTGMAILVVSAHEELLYAERALRAGAKGYIMKTELTKEVMKAIRKVLRGGVYLSERMHDRLVGMLTGAEPTPSRSNVERLSDRELEVFRLIGKGRSTRSVAAALHLAVSTVGTYRAKIKEKLGLAGAAELIRRAVEWAYDPDGPR